MGRLVASGSLVGVSDEALYDDRTWEDKYTGGIGILLGGTFNGGEIIAVKTTAPDIVHEPNLGGFNPENAARTYLRLDSAGMYFISTYLYGLVLTLSSGTVDVTDIDYWIFFKTRP